jgi:hypothetical protein
LQADAYTGFDALYESGPVVEAACWTHAWRYFHGELLANGSSLARETIERMQPLFAIKTEIHDQPPEVRVAARQARSAPMMAGLHGWLEATLRRISGKSNLAKAIRYTLAQWSALTAVLRDGRACLYNNAAERRVGPLPLGQKNDLFAGSLEGRQARGDPLHSGRHRRTEQLGPAGPPARAARPHRRSPDQPDQRTHAMKPPARRSLTSLTLLAPQRPMHAYGVSPDRSLL